jgi:ATP-dependent exoDNAse (exonuclease V) beta subunit
VATGVPVFRGKDTVLERPDGEMPGMSTVRPGAYELVDASSGEPYTVVWWDPTLLDRAGNDTRGLRRDDLIAKDARPEDVAADRARYREWQDTRAALHERAARPSLRIATTTEYVKEHVQDRDDLTGVPVSILDASVAAMRPAGRRFGILVHALLAHVPLDADSAAVRGAAALHARVLGAPDDERDAAATVVARVLQHEVWQQARAAAESGRACRREAPISFMRDGTLIDGQIDLAFETAAGWTVVDFKTDAELGANEDVYRRQVALYADALSAITATPAVALILRV